jgi:hypothetical protein
MAQRSLLDEDWDDLLCGEKLILQYENTPHELTPREAFKRVLVDRHHLVLEEIVPHTSAWSWLYRLEKYERAHREELRQILGPVPRTVIHNISVKTPQKVTYRVFDRIVRLIRRSR